jgi:hypothetical protein
MVQAARSRVRLLIKSIFFSAPNPSSRTMAPVFTQPLTETNTRRFLGVKRGRRVSLTTKPPSMNRLSRQCESPDISKQYRPPWPVTGISLFILCCIHCAKLSFIVCVAFCGVLSESGALFVCYMYFCVLCFIVVPLPPGKNTFAIQYIYMILVVLSGFQTPDSGSPSRKFAEPLPNFIWEQVINASVTKLC